jgi:hypothetical protein
VPAGSGSSELIRITLSRKDETFNPNSSRQYSVTKAAALGHDIDVPYMSSTSSSLLDIALWIATPGVTSSGLMMPLNDGPRDEKLAT